jgi:hypothetical protein
LLEAVVAVVHTQTIVTLVMPTQEVVVALAVALVVEEE